MSTAVTTEQVEKVVIESLATFGADPDQITPEATFEALDIDSLDLAELSQIVHEQFGDGIISAINFKLDIKKVADPDGGERAVITLDGKYLPTKPF